MLMTKRWLSIVLAMALASPIQATEVLSDPGFSATPIEKCNNALNTCSLYVTHLTGSVERLQKLAKMYKDQRDLAIVQAGKNLNDAGLPSWAWAAIGAVAASGLWGIFYYNRSQH